MLTTRKALARGVLLSKRWSSSLNPTIKDMHVNPPQPDTLISVQGFVKNIRQFRKVGFVDINDGSIFKNLNVTLKNPTEIPDLKIGQSLNVKGDWVVSPGKQPFELVYDSKNPNHEMKIVGDIAEDYPVHKEMTVAHLRQFPSLRHRTSSLASILRLRSFLETKFMEFFNSRNFTKVTPPIITSSDCEGAGEVFKVEPVEKTEEAFFGKDSYLTVSTQLHLEVLSLALNRAWTLTPCFRAENSKTTRHLSEFWMLEAELSYIDNLDQLTGFTEDMVRYVTKLLVKDVLEKGTSANIDETFESGDGTDLLGSSFGSDEQVLKRWSALLTPDKWPRMTYTEAVEHLNKQLPREEQIVWGDSLLLKHEKQLAENSPIFITDYPVSQKPFYMLKSKNFNPDKPTVACFDLLIPEFGELAGGSLREHNYGILLQDMKNHGMNLEDMEWYLTLRRNGTIPHGGFGLGFERLITYLSGRESLRDISAFPRAPSLCSC